MEFLQMNERDLTDLERSHSDEDHNLIQEETHGKSNALLTTNTTNN